MTQEESPLSDSHLYMIVHCTFSKSEQKTKNVFDNLVILETRPEKIGKITTTTKTELQKTITIKFIAYSNRTEILIVFQVP